MKIWKDGSKLARNIRKFEGISNNLKKKIKKMKNGTYIEGNNMKKTVEDVREINGKDEV